MSMFGYRKVLIAAFSFLIIPAMINCQLRPCSHSNPWVAEWLADPLDCRGYYICAFNNAFHLYCEQNTVWQPQYKVCCLRGSYMDICTTGQPGVQPPPGLPSPGGTGGTTTTCQPGMTTKLPHPTNCARYYDCTQPAALQQLGQPYERECLYPTLFNRVTRTCEHYSNVTCAAGFIPKDPCDYVMNQCFVANCSPCYLRFPSCAGLPNGRNVWKGRENTPDYVICRNSRIESQRQCPFVGGVQYVFHSTLKLCIEFI